MDPLTDEIIATDYELKPVLKLLLKSEHFFGDDISDRNNLIGAMISSPLEQIMFCVGVFDIDYSKMSVNAEKQRRFFYNWLFKTLQASGMELFRPSDVAGYPAYYQVPTFYREWFNSSTILARYKLPEMILTKKRVLSPGNLQGMQKFDVVQWFMNHVEPSKRADADEVVTFFLKYLLSSVPEGERYNYYYQDVFLGEGLTEDNWRFNAWGAFESSGYTEENYFLVEQPLKDLFSAILYSPEFQLL